MLERVAERAAAPEQSRRHCALRDLEHLGDLPLSKAIDVDQHDHRTEPVVEAGERTRHAGAEIRRLGRLEWRWCGTPGGKRALELAVVQVGLASLRMSPPRTQTVQVRSYENREQPAARRPGIAQLGKPMKGAQHRLLEKVFGVGPMSVAEARRRPVERVEVLAQQLLERPRLDFTLSRASPHVMSVLTTR